LPFKPDVLIVDPARSGLDKDCKIEINKLLPKKIIYVSCNPLTLARDLKELSAYYKISEIYCYRDKFTLTI
jgi:tRNA/tmRNA/rRNA uracil-C5-methylase (TrmA/RlmC/RlmD family)